MRLPSALIQAAIEQYKPVKIFVGFSGGNDSLTVTKWMMDNVPGTVALHCNTGIGIEKTREFVRETCRDFGWPYLEVRAKEDCGQDYDELVRERGFPGPNMHRKMYNRLKERCIDKAVRDSKTKWSDKVLIATGIRHDESRVRAGYAGREINVTGAKVWVNPLYSWSKQQFSEYRKQHNLPKNPVAEALGMSGECLCGAYASPGEKERVRAIDPEVAARIDSLEKECLMKGFTWSWEGHPPEGGFNPDQFSMDFDLEQPMCSSCNKVGLLKAIKLATS